MLYWAQNNEALQTGSRCGRSRRASASRCSARRSRCSTTPSTRSATRRCACGSSIASRPACRAPAPAPVDPLEPLLEVRDLVRRVRHRRRAGPRGRRRRPRRRARRVPRRRRRVRLRQVDDAVRDRAAARPAARGEITRRQRALQGPRPGRAAPSSELRAHALARLLGGHAERDERAEPGADASARSSRTRCEAHGEHVAARRSRRARARCCGSSASTRCTCTATRTSSPAACGSAR